MQTALITGASSGIGEELARLFAQDGHNLVLVARSQAKLEALSEQLTAEHDITAWVETADLSKRGAAKKLAANLAGQNIDIDVLVNNAGVLEHGRFVDIGASAHQRMLDLNISGLTSILDQFLPSMVQRGGGRVLNVASIAAFSPVPSLATYAASKAFVLSLTESLSEELKGTGVTITALCPGMTATSMLDTAQAQSAGLSIPDFMVGEVEDVAAQGYKACMKGEIICVPGNINLATTLAGRAMPKWLLRRISGVIGRYTTES